MSEFESFMISVDFCSEPVTFTIAKKSFRFEFEHPGSTRAAHRVAASTVSRPNPSAPCQPIIDPSVCCILQPLWQVFAQT